MNFKKQKLPSGITLITIPTQDSPATTVLVLVEVGSNYESAKDNGISHFLEHMIFKGTAKRPTALAISHELEGLGANYNAFTGNEYTGYYAKVEARHFDRALDIVSDMYMNPRFNEAEIEKEKGVIIEEIRMYNDLPHRKVQDNLEELLYGDQPAGRNIAGSEETVRSFGREDFVRYRGEHYTPESTIVILSGNFDESSSVAQVESAFAGLGINNNKHSRQGKDPVTESQSKPAFHIESKETDQTHIAIAFRTVPVLDRRTPAIRLLASVLGAGMSSRLFQKLREEMGVCYYVRAEAGSATDHGSLNISAGVDNSRVEEVTEVLLEECERMKAELVPESELRRVKDFLIGSMMLSLETSDALAEFYGFQYVLKKEALTPKELAAQIESVTAEEVRDMAKFVFTKNKLNIALIGKFSDENALCTIVNRVVS